MSVNLYEITYHFEKEFRKSDEYLRFVRLYSEVNADPATKQLFRKLNNLQMELQQKQMMGQEIRQQEVEELQKRVAAAQQNQKIAELMEADQRVNMLMMELSKIMTKPLEDIYNNFEGR